MTNGQKIVINIVTKVDSLPFTKDEGRWFLGRAQRPAPTTKNEGRGTRVRSPSVSLRSTAPSRREPYEGRGTGVYPLRVASDPPPLATRGGITGDDGSPHPPQAVPLLLIGEGFTRDGGRGDGFSLSLATLDSGRNHRLLPALAKNMPPACFLNASRPSRREAYVGRRDFG